MASPLVLSFVTTAIVVAVVPAYSLPTEAEALLRTGWWSSNGGDNTWGHCIWQGISCNKAGSITRIDRHGAVGSGFFDKLEKLKFCFPNLVYLNLAQFVVNGSIPPQIGPIPREIGNLNLRVLSLSNNPINGSIPLEVFTCPSSTLDLSHNFIEGEIPHRDGNCVFVSNLDLSHNNLTGMIPDIFEAVDTVNLSYNSLQGPIPHYLIDSFGPDSFRGNKHLCANLPGFCDCPASNKIVEIEQKSEDPHALISLKGFCEN
ncbi:hypothetical protein V6N13_084195 [Hibiscus sabdariffa]